MCCSHTHPHKPCGVQPQSCTICCCLSRGYRWQYCACLAQGHLQHTLRWLMSHLSPPHAQIFSQACLTDYTPTPHPRSQSGTDLLPFPTTAETQIRLLYHCQQQLIGLASLAFLVGPWSVLKHRAACWIIGPIHCFLSPGRLLCNNAQGDGSGGGGVLVGERVPSSCREHHCQAGRETFTACTCGYWSAWQITASTAAPGFRVCSSRSAPIWDG